MALVCQAVLVSPREVGSAIIFFVLSFQISIDSLGAMSLYCSPQQPCRSVKVAITEGANISVWGILSWDPEVPNVFLLMRCRILETTTEGLYGHLCCGLQPVCTDRFVVHLGIPSLRFP